MKGEEKPLSFCYISICILMNTGLYMFSSVSNTKCDEFVYGNLIPCFCILNVFDLLMFFQSCISA